MNKELGRAKPHRERAQEARRCVGKMRQKLLCPTPEALESGAGDLAEAIRCLQRLEADLNSRPHAEPAARAALEAEIGSLRRDLQQVNALLEQSAKFYEGWARLAGAACPEIESIQYGRLNKSSASAPTDKPRLVLHG